jgi:hypothetical protein
LFPQGDDRLDDRRPGIGGHQRTVEIAQRSTNPICTVSCGCHHF